jgi:hypothetical protein
MTRLLQSGLPTSNDELILLYQEHKVRLYTSKSSTHFLFFLFTTKDILNRKSIVLSVDLYSSVSKIIVR